MKYHVSTLNQLHLYNVVLPRADTPCIQLILFEGEQVLHMPRQLP